MKRGLRAVLGISASPLTRRGAMSLARHGRGSHARSKKPGAGPPGPVGASLVSTLFWKILVTRVNWKNARRRSSRISRCRVVLSSHGEPPAPSISAPAGGRGRAFGRVGRRAGADVADAAGARDRAVPARRLDRHFRAPRRAKTHRAFRQAVLRRER